MLKKVGLGILLGFVFRCESYDHYDHKIGDHDGHDHSHEEPLSN
jgi:hypothetical protein